MQVPYIERICKLCPLKGIVSEPVHFGDYGQMRYVDCQRDNEGAKEHYIHTLKDENDLWLRQIGSFEHCIYAYEDASALIN